MKDMSLEEASIILNTFRAQRAFDAGYQAKLKGIARDAIPSDMGIFSGKWVEGWWAAEMDLVPVPDVLMPHPILHTMDTLPPPDVTLSEPVAEAISC